MEPTTFGEESRFRVLRRLGEGGMGIVYEAIDDLRRTRVALKTIRAIDPDSLVRFKREFRALQDLHHENLVNLGELFCDAGTWFFTMELVDGEDILGHVRKGAPPGAPPPDYALLRRAVAQLVSGLVTLHASKKVHRDIKPPNVLVRRDGRVVILDLGVVADLEEPVRAAPDGVVGTVAYMAPEQILADEEVGPPCDLYAVGVLLYELLTGLLPFSGSAAAMMSAKVEQVPPPPASRVPGTPADLDALTTALLAQSPADRPTALEVLEVLEGAAQPKEVGSRSSSLFVGREAELGKLRAAYARARGGLATVVAIEGESGVGKSALLSELTRELKAKGNAPLILTGRCRERELIPYKAFDGVFDGVARVLEDPEEREALMPERARLLEQVFPTLFADGGAAPVSESVLGLDPIEQRRRIFDEARALFARMSARRPVVLLIDDLQWADADSFALAQAILRPPSAPPLFVLTTERRRQPGDHPLDVGEGFLRLPLAPLSTSESKILAAALPEASHLDPGKVERLIAESGGHPMFLDALLRFAAEGGAIGGDLRLDDALWVQVQRLDEGARALMALIAVAGFPVSSLVLADAADLDPTTVAVHLASLRHGRFIRGADPSPTDLFEPFHDRVREAVLARTQGTERLQAHSRLAQALLASASVGPERIAAQFHEAGQAAKAAPYALRAAEQAMAAFAFDQAAELYRIALTAPEATSLPASELWRRRGDALAAAGRGADSAHPYLRAAELLPGDAALTLEQRAAEQLLVAGHMAEGRAVVRKVLVAVGIRWPGAPLIALASFLFRRILVRLRQYRFVERPLAEVAPRELLVLDLLWSLAFVLSFVDTVRGGDFQARHLLRALDAGEPLRVARALATEVPYGASIGADGWASTDRLHVQATALAERSGDPWSVGYTTCAGGIASYLAGRFEEAVPRLDRGMALMERLAGTWGLVMRTRQFGCYALAMLGRFRELAARLPGFERDAEAHGDVYGATNLGVGLPHATWLVRDDVARARAVLTQAQRWKAEGFTLEHYYTLFAEVQLALYEGDGALAHRLTEIRWRAFERSFLLRIQSIRFNALYMRGRAALGALAAGLEGDARRAPVAVVRKVVKHFRRSPGTWGEPLGLLLSAGLASASGGDGSSELARAVPLLDRFGLRLHAACARLALGQADAARYFAEEEIPHPERVLRLMLPAARAGSGRSGASG